MHSGPGVPAGRKTRRRTRFPFPDRHVFLQGWVTLAGMYAALDNAARAIEIYNMVLETDPANEQARDGLRNLGIDP